MAPGFVSAFASVLSVAFLLQRTLSQTVERRYDNNEIKVDESKHDLQFFNFVTRPDIDAPRWDIKIHDEEALSDGLWFTAPYGIVGQTDHKKAYVGPHIYDGRGELVWSGAPLFQGYDAFDFKVSTVEGQDMLTAIWPHKGIVAIIDSSYEIYKTIDIGDEKKNTLNLHDFQMIGNGTRAIVATKIPKKASLELSRTVKYNGRCNVEFDGFEERDLESDARLFEWTSEGMIGLDESTLPARPPRACRERKVGDAWDYFHINSIDKLPDNDYLISGRRTYALYKISHKDGSILWRLGGKHSDFEWRGEDRHFSGQHDARFLSQNETHMLVSIMDNAFGPGRPFKTNDNSRGLVLALQTNTKPMTVEVVAKYPHPHGGYAPARGNFQTLPNGNAFLCWTTDALQSEHTPDGTRIMEAKLKSGLKSYRSYKMPWIGRPTSPPDVVSQAVTKNNGTSTVVFVSWNGATEVVTWRIYKTGPEGLVGTFEVVALVHKQGFESNLLFPGFAKFVVVQALDRDGKEFGASRVVETVLPPEGNFNADVLAEMEWQQNNFGDGSEEQSWRETVVDTVENPIATFFGGILFSVAAGLTVWGVWTLVQRRKRTGGGQAYEQLGGDGQEKEEMEMELDEDEGASGDDETVVVGRRSGTYGD